MARKNSGATAAKPRKSKQRFAQAKQIYELAHTDDPRIGLWMFLVAAGVTLVGYLLGLWGGRPTYGTLLALPFGLLAAVFLLSRRAEKAAYGRLDGQPGAGGAAMQGLRRGWRVTQEPYAVDAGRSQNPRDAAMVFRAVGRPGVVLVGDGPTGRTERLLAAEKRRITKMLPNVPVTAYRVGTGEGENVVTARTLVTRMQKMKPVLTKEEVGAVDRRLTAMLRTKPPVPAGVDPNRIRSQRRQPR